MEFSDSRPYSIPMAKPFRGLTHREGVLIRGPLGWADFCPFPEYDDAEAASWLAAAVEQCTHGWPAPVRSSVPVNCIVPAVSADQAADIAAASGCSTAKVKVGGDHAADLERVSAVAGVVGAVRVDANGAWPVDEAVRRIRELDRAAGGLQYVEQPCASLDDLAAVRRRVAVPIAADESIRRASDPLRVAVAGAADVAVIKCTPLGGVQRALHVADACGLPCVVSSALETSVGLAAQVALAAALPELDFACGLDTLSLLAGDVATPSLVPVDGFVSVPAEPPSVDLDALARWSMPDADRRSWWLDRLRRVSALIG